MIRINPHRASSNTLRALTKQLIDLVSKVSPAAAAAVLEGPYRRARSDAELAKHALGFSRGLDEFDLDELSSSDQQRLNQLLTDITTQALALVP